MDHLATAAFIGHGSDASDERDGRAPKRQRTAVACEPCRLRKRRCDGAVPCKNCGELKIECVYHKPSAYTNGAQSKSDRILGTVTRIESLLLSLHKDSPNVMERDGDTSEDNEDGHRKLHLMAADIPASHTSATEQMMSWKIFDQYVSVRNSFECIFQIENARAQFDLTPTNQISYISDEEANKSKYSFSGSFNFWYPVVEHVQLEQCCRIAVNHRSSPSCEKCLGLLALALGSAARQNESKTLVEVNEFGNMAAYLFKSAYQMIHLSVLVNSSESLLCLFLTAIYFLYVQRPLQAWHFINQAAMKFQLMWAYTASDCNSTQIEILKRVFWSCYSVESDIVAELNEIPQSGLSNSEALVQLPDRLESHSSSEVSQDSTLYFLACISLRRLLNRTHKLLYAKARIETRFSTLVNVATELEHQLNQWRELLPPQLQFPLDLTAAPNEQSGFLRQRYFTCRAVIFRPFLQQALVSGTVDTPEQLQMCKSCLESCCLHVGNLRRYRQTVLVDSWICALSMTGTMMLLLASLDLEQTRGLTPTYAKNFGHNLISFFTQCHNPVTDQSPTVQQCISTIGLIDESMKARAYGVKDPMF